MTNKYLEKLAADYSLQKEAGNAYKNFLASKGKDVSGISNSSLVASIPGAKKPGSFGNMSIKANKAGLMPSAKPSLTSRIKSLSGQGPKLSSGAQSVKAGLSSRGASLHSALQSHVAAKQAAPAAAAAGGVMGTAKGYLNKAIGFAKAHPKGVALGAVGAVGGLALASRMGKSQEPQYPGMY